MSGRLTEEFRGMIEMRWDDFAALEKSPDATNFDSVLTGIVRACRKGTLRAIQTALDRLDGKIATELEVEYPKFYVLYPYATKKANDPTIIEGDELDFKSDDIPTVIAPPRAAAADMEELDAEAEELPTGSLRAVLEKMLDSPKTIVDSILNSADRVDEGDYSGGNPYVKSVIVAGLMKLVHDGRMSAVFEIFDQIDGKVADKLKVLGDDVYLTRFDAIAPAEAVKNADGVYEVVAENVTNMWTARLEQGKGKR